jgi:uncharacterized protein (DUF433 family)
MSYQQFININPEIRFGKPCINGNRISVYDVLSLFAAGITREEILADNPPLNNDQLTACLQYAADKERIVKYA